MTRRRTAVFAGCAVAIAYLLSAVWSGSLSPLARRPLLDGFAPPPPYRWVSPPPAQAASNKPPTAAKASLTLSAKGSKAAFVSTPDAQVTMILGTGAFPPAAGQTAVAITITPLDPAKLAPAPAGLSVEGNAYLVQASYEPSKTSLRSSRAEFTITINYPAAPTTGATPTKHSIIQSGNGRSWTRLRTNDSHAGLVTNADTTALGYFAVAGPPAAKSVSSQHSAALAIALVVALALAGVALIVVARRGRGRRA